MAVLTQADLDSWAAQLATAEAADKAQFDAIIAAIKAGTLPAPVVVPPDPGTGPVVDPIQGFTDLTLGDPNVWNQKPDFQENFPTPVNMGSFGGTYKYWSLYPDGWKDSYGGTYHHGNIGVIKLPDGTTVMRQVVQNNGSVFGGSVAQPEFGPSGIGYAKSQRLSVRRRLSQRGNAHDTILGWPANDNDWAVKSGEPDMIESDCNSGNVGGFIHLIGGSSNSDNQNHQIEIKSDVDPTQWNSFVFELRENNSFRRYINGKLYNVILNPGVAATAADNAAWAKPVQLSNGWSVPGADALRDCFQFDSNGQRPGSSIATMDTDYVVIQTLK